jgi:adenosylhomocysteine nucleosidase
MVGIIGAMEPEVELLRSNLQNVSIEKMGSFEYIQGSLPAADGGQNHVVLLRCGIGKVNAGIGCALMAERYKPDCIINTGCAGGINPQGAPVFLNFGDVVVSNCLVQHDVDVTAFGRAPGEIPGMSPLFWVDKKLVGAAIKAIEDLKSEKTLPSTLHYVEGLIGSGDVFMCEKARIDRVVGIFPAMRAVEMEGAAIAQACILFNVPYIVIRALSDIAGEESPMKFDEYLPIAAKNSSEIVKRIVREIN